MYSPEVSEWFSVQKTRSVQINQILSSDTKDLKQEGLNLSKVEANVEYIPN